jgi:hypothetical protein
VKLRRPATTTYHPAVDGRGDEVAERLRQALAAGDIHADGLLALHESYATRWAASDSAGWAAGGVFVPVALAAPAAYFGLSQQRWGELLAFSVASILLSVVYLVVGEIQRALSIRSASVMLAVERALGLDLGPPMLLDGSLSQRLSSRVGVQVIRRGLPVLLAVFWAVVWVARLGGG